MASHATAVKLYETENNALSVYIRTFGVLPLPSEFYRQKQDGFCRTYSTCFDKKSMEPMLCRSGRDTTSKIVISRARESRYSIKIGLA